MLLISLLYIASVYSCDYVRELVHSIDCRCGKPLKLRDYASNCEFDKNTSNVYHLFNFFAHEIFDVYFIGHMVGGILHGGFIINNRLLLWCMSIQWEILEFSTKFFIKNFAECWWDSLIMDILICNGLSIEIGLLISKYLKNKGYLYTPKWNNDIFTTNRLFCKNKHQQNACRPRWIRLKEYLSINFLFLIIIMLDLNPFLLKYYLFVPADHYCLILHRLLSWLSLIPAMNQFHLYYVYYTNNSTMMIKENTKKSISCVRNWLDTMQLCVFLIILIVEFILSIKMMPASMSPLSVSIPSMNLILWVVLALLFCIFSFIALV